ncbi:MAG: glycine zipper domain-containing protein [Polaromonas sp.]
MTANTASKIPQEAAPAMRQTPEELLKIAGNAVDSTRGYANDALDKAESRVRELRGSVDPVVDMLTSKAQKLARHSLDLASEAKYQAEQSLRRATRVTTRYVADQPLRSVLIAAAVGAVVALLISSSRHRNRNRY